MVPDSCRPFETTLHRRKSCRCFTRIALFSPSNHYPTIIEGLPIGALPYLYAEEHCSSPRYHDVIRKLLQGTTYTCVIGKVIRSLRSHPGCWNDPTFQIVGHAQRIGCTAKANLTLHRILGEAISVIVTSISNLVTRVNQVGAASS